MAAKAKETGMMNPFSGGERKVGPKVVRELRIAPMMGGGHTVTHEHMNYDHAPEVHQFEPEEGPAFHKHIEKHTGMKMAEEKAEKKGKGGNKAEMKEDAEEEGEE